MTDGTVPEGHKGLHGFLYGDGGAEVHDEADKQYQSREVLFTAIQCLCLQCSCNRGSCHLYLGFADHKNVN